MKHFHTVRIAVYLLLIKNNRILLMRRYNTGWMDETYSVVSGHLEAQETIKSAMQREAKEEAGIIISQKDLRLIHVLHRKSDADYIDFFFTADRWKGEPHNTEPQKCDDMQWFTIDRLPENILPYIKTVLTSYESKVLFSENGL